MPESVPALVYLVAAVDLLPGDVVGALL
jgi:hypothetical protein